MQAGRQAPRLLPAVAQPAAGEAGGERPCLCVHLALARDVVGEGVAVGGEGVADLQRGQRAAWNDQRFT
jgi:hypothetical protein